MDKKTSQRQKRQPKGLEGNVWDCSVCTFSNTAEAFKCAMCDVRKGTSTRKPRLNPQLVAQQAAQHMTATATVTATTAPKPPPVPQQRRDDIKERRQVQTALASSDEKEKVSKKKIRNIRPRLKNVDRTQVHSQPVTVNNITVVITEYLSKPPAQPSTSSQSNAGVGPSSGSVTDEPKPINTGNANHELPNGIHIPPKQHS